MAEFTYNVLTWQGTRETGRINAGTQQEAKAVLSKEHTKVFSVKKSSVFTFGRRQLGNSELEVMFSDMADWSEGGNGIVDVLSNMASHAESRRARGVSSVLLTRAKKGMSARELFAIDDLPTFISESFAEKDQQESVTYTVAFRQLSEHYQQCAETVAEAGKKMAYPSVILLAAFGLMIMLCGVAIPEVAFIYEFSENVSISAKILLFMSNILVTYWIHLLIGVMGLIVVVYLLFALYSDKAYVLLMKTPFLGKAIKTINLATIFGRFAVMQANGLTARETLKNLSSDTYFGRQFALILKDFERGVELSEAFERRGVFDSIVLAKIAKGKATNVVQGVTGKTSQDQAEGKDIEINKLATAANEIVQRYKKLTRRHLTRFGVVAPSIGMGLCVVLILMAAFGFFIPLMNMGQ